MTFKKIRSELENIYQERSKWDGGKGPFTEREIRRRELILIKTTSSLSIRKSKIVER